MASVKWSKWPWVASMTSQRSTSPGAFGLRGFANHGSNRTVLPPGVRSSQQEWPYQVIVVSAGRAIRCDLLGATARVVSGDRRWPSMNHRAPASDLHARQTRHIRPIVANYAPAVPPPGPADASPDVPPSRSGAPVIRPGRLRACLRAPSSIPVRQSDRRRTFVTRAVRQKGAWGERQGASRFFVMRKLSLAASVALVAAIVIPSTASAAWPVATRSSYVSTWYSSRHPAIDIAAPSGTHVVPFGNRSYVFAGYTANCGGYQVWVRNHDVY